MNQSKTLGIAIPTYKRENYLRILLNSIPKDIEVQISDNGGFTSAEFKKEYSHCKFKSTEIVVNMFQNWNNAITGLETEWICLASDDDVFFSNAFESFYSNLKKFPDSEIIIFGHKNIDENDKQLSQWVVPAILQMSPPFGYDVFKYGVDSRPISVFFKKELYEKVGRLDETYKITSADSDFTQQALLKGNALFVPEIISGYRIWNKSLTSTLNASTEWMDEIYLWQSKIRIELQKLNIPEKEIKTNMDEVVARNLISGLVTLRKQKKGITEFLKYLRQFEYPIHATIKTQLSLIKCLLKASLKI